MQAQINPTIELMTYVASNYCSKCIHDASEEYCCAIFAETLVAGTGKPDEWVDLGKGITCTAYSEVLQ